MKSTLLFVALIISVTLTFQSCSTPVQTRDETYIEIEKQKIKLTYLVKDDKMRYKRTDGVMLLNQLPKLTVYTTITNTSSYDGVFEFKAKLTSQNNSIYFSTKEFIPAGSTLVFKQTKEINYYSFSANVDVDSWSVIPPIKSVNVEVIKHRTVVI